MSVHVGIFGPSLFGKSHLGKHLAAQYWRLDRRPSIVLDPNGDDWGPSALVFVDREAFLRAVWEKRNCAVFCDEFGEVFDRDKAASPLFTRLRHQGHLMHALSHLFTDLLPKQRNQLGTLFLFWQTAEAADAIAREWSDERLRQAPTLPKYVFLHCRKFGAGAQHIITPGKLPR